jgi:hypothetical protein
MKRRILVISTLLLVYSGISFGQVGNFRSLGSGPWGTAGTWERDADSNGSFEESPSTVSPTSASGTITIQNTHTVNVAASVTIDQTTVQSGGTLTIDATFVLTLNNGDGNEITVDAGGVITNNGTLAFTTSIPSRNVLVNGTLNNTGSITNPATTKLTFGSGSNYFHQFADGGTIPLASWNSNSTVNIVGYTVNNSTAPSGLNQTFGHFVWNAPLQGKTISLGGFPTTINGDFRLESTGSDALFYSLGGAGNTMSIGGNFDINGGTLGWTSGDAGTSTLNITGNMDISGSSYVQLADDQNLTVNLTGNFVVSGSAVLDFSAGAAITNLNIQGNYTFSGGDIFVNGGTGNVNFTGASTKVFTSTLVPTGSVNYSVASLSTLTVPGSNFVGGGGSFTLNGTLQLGSTDAGGALQTGTSGNIRVSGTRTYASNSTIVYNGSAAQFIGNGFPPSGVVNLTINNSNNVTLSTSLDIVALSVLTLSSGNIVIGSQTLTINGTLSGSGGIVGGSSSNLVIGGTGDFGILTLSGSTQLSTFTLNRTSSGLVTLGGNLTIIGTFTHTAGTLAVAGNTLTISGAYGPANPDDISVTSSSTIVINGSGSLPTDIGFAGGSLGTLTLNRASATLASTANITITNLFLTSGTFSNGSGITIATGGTITRSGGSMTTNPTNTTNSYNVVYTSGTITTGPELPGNTTALANLSKTGTGALTLGSAVTINGVFTLSSGSFNAGANAIDLKGNFISDASSTLTSSAITFSGTTTILGSSTPTFGAITIANTGTLTPTSSFQINGNLTNNGVLNAGSGTTTFGGTTTISGSSTSSFNNVTISNTLTAPTGNFNVAGTWTNNGTFNAGVATNTVTFNGTSSIAGSSATNFSGIIISATLTAPASLNLAGNFTNNGTFSSGTGTVLFNGSATQAIQGSTVTNFNNITVTNVGGPPAVTVQSDQNLRGVLTLSGATSQFDSDGSGNTSVFTLLSSGDSPTVDASVATLPAGASVLGNVTVQRFMAIEGGNNTRIYRYISSPVQSAPVSQIQSEIPVTGSFTGTSTCTGCGSGQSMFLYNESITTDTNGSGGNNFDDGYEDFPSVANSETLTGGRGYTIFVRGNVNPVASNGSARWDVRAPINSGTINFNAFTTFTSSGILANDGWNLVGNPYPATIDWDAAGWTKTGINNALYLRDNGLASPLYATYIAGVGVNGGSRYIAMGQAFFVKSDGGPIDFQATETVKAAGTQTTFFRKAAINDILRVALKNGTITDETVVRFNPAASDNFDPALDAYKLKNAVFNLSSVSNEIKYAINALPKLDCSKSVSLDVSNAELGSYNLLFSEFESFDETMEIQLTDKFLGQTINIRNKSDYQFEVTSDQNSQGKRFTLVFALASVDVSILPKGPATLCGNASYSITLPTSEFGVAYYASLNGTTISDNIVGTGNILAIGIDEAKLALGQNNLLIYAKRATCDAVPLMEALAVTRDNIYQIQSAFATSACQQGSVTLSASGAPENGSYHWYESLSATEPISGVSGKTFTTPLLDKTKTYYVAAVNAIGCEGERTQIKAEVIKYDEILVTETTYGVLSSSYTTGNTWYVNDVLIPGAKSQSITVTQSGVYRVEVAIGNCKTSASYEFVVTGMERKDDGIEIYPNPVQEELTIQGLKNVHAIELISNIGLLIKTQEVKETSVTMDMKNYPAGLYLVKLVGANNSVSTFKVIKK